MIEKFFATPSKFVLSVNKVNDLPVFDIPEVAFIGRSNVGKSSIINALVNRKLAHTSNTPGRTRMLNYFLINNQMHLVDLPGYGYAKAPKVEIYHWNQLIYEYLRVRTALRRIFLLIDSRHGLKKNDLEMINFLTNFATTIQIVLTKSDKIKQNALSDLKLSIETELTKFAIIYPKVIATSSISKEGLYELKSEIYNLSAL